MPRGWGIEHQLKKKSQIPGGVPGCGGELVSARIGKISVYKHLFCYSNVPTTGTKELFGSDFTIPGHSESVGYEEPQSAVPWS